MRNHLAIVLSVAALAVFLVVHVLIGRDPAKNVVDSLVVGSAVIISMTWARASFRALRSGMKNGASNILVSVWLVWTVLLGYFVWVIVFGAAGRPAGWRETPIGGLFSTFFFLSGCFAILAPVNAGRELEKTSLVWWFASVALGSLVAGALMAAAFLKIFSYA